MLSGDITQMVIKRPCDKCDHHTRTCRDKCAAYCLYRMMLERKKEAQIAVGAYYSGYWTGIAHRMACDNKRGKQKK